MIFLFAPFGFFVGGNFDLNFRNRNNNNANQNNRNGGAAFNGNSEGNNGNNGNNEEHEQVLHPMTSTLPFMLLTLSIDGTALVFLPILLMSVLAPGSRWDVFNLLNGLSANRQLGAILTCLFLVYNIVTIIYHEDERPTNANVNRDSRARTEASRQDFSNSSYFDWVLPVFFLVLFYLIPMYWSRIYTLLATSSYIPQYYRDSWVAWAANYGLAPEAPAMGNVPTSKKVLDGLKDHTLEGNVSTTCAVCLEKFKSGDTVKRLPCKHYFHPPCVLPWLVKHCTCPSCRYELPTDDIIYEESRNVRNTVHSR